jgi:hypothetical protein
MRKINASHIIDCDAETFWKLYFDETYFKAFYLDELGFKQLELIDKTDTTRKLRGVPKLNMPGPVMKLLGDSFGYEEHGNLDRDKNEWRWKMLPNTMADKLATSGIIRLEPAGEGKVRRLDEATLDAKVFGIGKLIEGSTEKEVRSAWDKEARFMNKWVREHE